MRLRVRSMGWAVVVGLGMMLVLGGCGGTGETLVKMPFLSVTVKAVDEQGKPVAGARVESSDGQKALTDEQGLATLRFGSLGVHTVTVAAQGRAPSAIRVSMPMDRGKTFEVRVGPPVEVSAGIQVSGAAGGFPGGLMAAQFYPFLFQAMFAAYGYSMDLEAYEPGEWTEWEVRTDEDDEPLIMRKAFLTRLPDGREWWQIKVKAGGEDDEQIVLEMMFSKDRRSLRRMRQKTGDGEPSEVPVAEGWYTEPIELTPESVEGAVKERGVSVTVPAGTFRADLMEFAMMGAAEVLRMWRVSEVPGGLVQAEILESGGGFLWQSRLRAHGTGASTELGSY